MTDTFMVGDKVHNTVFGDGEIVYGPLARNGHGSSYVMRGTDGLEHTVHSDYTTAIPEAPAFAVGDDVEHRTFGPAIVAFGPFEHFNGPGHYLIKLDDGRHSLVVPESLTLVEAAAPSHYVYEGVVYDLSAEYRADDEKYGDGDYWQFSRDTVSGPDTDDGNDDGTPLARWRHPRGEYGYHEWTWSLKEAVDTYGPLTRV